MLYNFLSDEMGSFMSASSDAGNFMLSVAPAYETVKAKFPIEISPLQEEI